MNLNIQQHIKKLNFIFGEMDLNIFDCSIFFPNYKVKNGKNGTIGFDSIYFYFWKF